MKNIYVLIVVQMLMTSLYGQTITSFFEKSDSFFNTYVSDGEVDYKAILSDSDSLEVILDIAKNVSVNKTEEKTYQAFWINAYNLAVIKGIINNYPLKSPLDKKGFFDKITYNLGGQAITLNDIENKKLRAVFNDARFHFVLVCGAKGCPPLISEAYQPEILDKQLEEQTIKAINNDTFIKVTKAKVALSEIFKWYKEDFSDKGKTEIDFLNKYRNNKISTKLKITYYTYNWQLNSN